MCESKTTLIRRLGNPHDTQAWEEFVDLYGATIFSWGKRLGLQHADAEDLTQEAFRRVVRSLPTYDRSRGRFRGWLYTIVRNEFLKWREKKAKLPLAAESAVLNEAASPEWDEAYDMHLLKLGLERLQRRISPRQWRIFWETEFGGKTPAEAAAAEGVSVGSVYVTRSRDISDLRGVILELEREAEEPL